MFAAGVAVLSSPSSTYQCGSGSKASRIVFTNPFRQEGRLHGDLFEREWLRLLSKMLDDGGVIDPVDGSCVRSWHATRCRPLPALVRC